MAGGAGPEQVVMARPATPPEVVRPVSVIHTTWQGAPIMLHPSHRLRASHPLVRQLGAASFVPEPPPDFEN